MQSPQSPQSPQSKMLDAFVSQTYGSYSKAHEADILANNNPNAKGNEHMDFEANQKLRQELASKFNTGTNLKSSINIPTKIKDGEINQKTEPHKNFKNYDHSLEMGRSSKLGLIKLNEGETGSVEDMFNSMFD